MSLICYLPFNEGSGTVANDNSGNGNNGTVSGATWYTSGKFGTALNFDGINDVVNLGNRFDVSYNSPQTYCAWINTTTTSNSMIMAKGMFSSPYTGTFFEFLDASGLRWQTLVDTSASGRFGKIWNVSGHNNGQWHHVAVVKGDANPTNLQLYLDGAIQTSVRTTYNTLITNVVTNIDFNIGARDNTFQIFEGLIDDARLYNHALTSNEVLNLYNTTTFEKYRLQSIEYREEDDALTLELSDVDEFFLGNIAELNKKMDINNVYGQGATNIWQVGPVIDNFQRVSAGEVYKTTLKIYIPAEAIAINKVKLNWTLGGFRTYTKVASTTTGNPSATHTHSVNIDNSMDTGNDCHLVGFQGNVAHVVDSGFVPTTWGTNANTADHTHEISVAHGIFVATDESPTMQLDVNSTTIGSSYTGDQVDIDITDYIVQGWNTIDVYPATGSNTKGYIQLDGFVQVFIESK